MSRGRHALNLVFTITAYPPSVGGAQIHLHQLARILAERHRVQVVTQWDETRSDWLLGTTLFAPGRSRDYLVDGIPVHRLGLGLDAKLLVAPGVLFYYPFMDVCLPLIARAVGAGLDPFASRADLIHNVRVGREALSYASLRAARRRGIPFVLTPVHHPRWTGWRYRAYLALYRAADLVIALTQAEKRTLGSLGVIEDRIRVTGIGPIVADHADPISFAEEHGLTGPVVLFVGQRFRYKGHLELMKAAPLVWRKHPDAHFVFIGPGAGEVGRGVSRGQDERVLDLGEVDLSVKTSALAACTVLCVPSTQESFGGVYLEAWSFGKPVIGCPNPAVAEVVSHGEDGLLVRQDPAEIADAICALLQSPSLARRMGELGRKKVVEKYNWDKIAAETERAYTDVLGSTPPSPLDEAANGPLP